MGTSVIVGLARRCFNLHKHLRRAYEESDPHYLAWAARTLVEVNVFTEYITSSEEQMRRFYQDLFVDGNTALNAATKSLDLLPHDHQGAAEGRKIVDNSRPTVASHATGQ